MLVGANDALVAKDELIACDDVIDQLLVPNTLPVNEPVKDPVLADPV